jgi:uncharacterized repeat protein (TIGR03803 family)
LWYGFQNHAERHSDHPTQLQRSDGANPFGGLLQGTDGSLYGTTYGGGSLGDGTVFRLSLGLGPFVKTLPASAKVGATIQILGTHLTGATSVAFNGTAAEFEIASPTLITATVPTGATSAPVQVTTPGGTLFQQRGFQTQAIASKPCGRENGHLPGDRLDRGRTHPTRVM